MSLILVVDDEEKLRNLLAMMIQREGHEVDKAENGKQALSYLMKKTYDLVISDIRMPEIDGKELIKEMRANKIFTPVVYITAFATVESAVEMMQAGAVDYISKPFDADRVFITIERSLALSAIYTENLQMKEVLKQQEPDYKIVYKSPSMKEVVSLAQSVAETDTAVLILGESGTGKELLARFIHQSGSRANKRFVPVNCAAISPSLVESELFGHEKGAFTGATSRKSGKFEFAAGGTLFLDEIGDMPLEAQAKLLRTLQEKKVQRVGGNQEIFADVRVICATNKNLELMVNKNLFRQDLYYRINVFPLVIPPLRNRMEDVAFLAPAIIKRFEMGAEHKITDDALKILEQYPWPGNVRELANVMERCIILTRDTKTITAQTLKFLQTNKAQDNSTGLQLKIPPGGLSLDQIQKTFVKKALEKAENNQTKAAALLGLSRSKFRILLKNMDD